MSRLGNRNVSQVTPDSNIPIIVYGDKVGVTVDYKGIVQDVPAYSMWVPNTDGKYVPLVPIAEVAAGSSTTVLALEVAADADNFNPANSDINPYWLSDNGGSQEITYYDMNATRTVVGLTGAAGEIYAESKAVDSADTSAGTITVGSAFSAAPADGDYILPGGIDGSSIHKQAIIVPRAVYIDELRDIQNDFTVEGYAGGTVLGYDRLSASVLALYDAGIIVDDANIKIDLTK